MEMDLNLFYFLIGFAFLLFLLTLKTHSGLRLALGWLNTGILIVIAAFFIKGGEITRTFVTVTDTVSTTTVPLSFGISTSNLVIVFLLFAVVSMSLSLSTSTN